MSKPIAPCLGCVAETGRSPTCHTTCPKYKVYVKECEAFREEKHRTCDENRVQWEIEARRKKMIKTGDMFRRRSKHD